MLPEIIEEICKLGQKQSQCSYLGRGQGGYCCLKDNPHFRSIIEKEVELSKKLRKQVMSENCSGYKVTVQFLTRTSLPILPDLMSQKDLSKFLEPEDAHMYTIL